MSDLTPEEEQAADRLGFQLLRDAFCDLAEMLRLVNPTDAEKMISTIEDRLVVLLTRLYLERAEGERSDEVVTVVGQRLSAILDEARDLSDRSRVSEATLSPAVD